MKKIKLLTILAAGLMFWGCKEELVYVTPLGSNGNPGDPGTLTRKVIAEELTGVRCPNCPEGTATLVGLGQQHGDKLIVVSIHAALSYDSPYPESKYDFRTAKGTEMANFIGAALGFPAASINRRIVPPETEPYLPRTAWAGIVDEELAKEPQIDVQVENTFSAATRKLDVAVSLTPVVDLSGTEHRLTVLITQDSIVDYQKVSLEKVPDYIHRHVLRDILTQATGDVISESLVDGVNVKKNFSIVLPANWDEKHCSVVAFVHHGATPDKEVLQADEEHVIK